MIYFLLDPLAPAGRSSEFLLDFLQGINTAVICLSPVMDC